MEQVAITGLVADVVAAFEHGETLVRKIKVKRAQSGAPLPPALLEQSLVRGPRAIIEVYETGREKYGDSFKIENNRAALDAFKDILLNLQSTFFQHLFTAQEDDAMSDFGVVVNAATMGRVKGVNVLIDMHMRMAETPQDCMGPNDIPPQPSLGSQQSQQKSPSQDSPFMSPAPGFIWNGDTQNTNAEVGSSIDGSVETNFSGTGSASSPFLPSQSPRVTKTATNRSYSSSDATDHTILSEDVDLVKFPAPPTNKNFGDWFPKPKGHVDTTEEGQNGQSVRFQQPESVSSEGKSLYGSSSGASLLSGASPEIGPYQVMPSISATSVNKILTGKIPFHESPPAEYRKRLNNKPKPKTVIDKDPVAPPSRPALLPSKSSSRKFSLLGGSKAPKGNYAGFCEGAYLIQRGQDGMKIRNQSISMTGQYNYWTCSNSKCCFEGPAVPMKNENKKMSFGFDEDILESHGVKYRWSFFAKSHTTISNSKAGYEYQCFFCIGRGVSPFRVKGNKKFIEHVANHQGQTPNKDKMPHFNYVVGRTASPWENFDINLPAATAMELQATETPAELEALEPRLPEMEAPLESPVNSPHQIRAMDGHVKGIDGSGLGIRMNTEDGSGLARAYNRNLRTISRPVDSEKTIQAVRSVDWRSNANYYHQNGMANANGNLTKDDEEAHDSPLDQKWTHVRDSIQSLHPAPLFSQKPSPSYVASHVGQEQRREPYSDQTYHRGSLPNSLQFDESDDFELDPYNLSIDDAEHALHGRILVHDSFRRPHATRPVESRQASMLMAERTHEISTPDLWHPGTKWMD